MTVPWLDDGDVKLYHGDALEQLALMPSESVQCIVTSPPFWGLRDYGTSSWEGSSDPDCDHLKTPHGRASSGLRNDGRAHTGPYEGEKATRTGTPYTDVCGKCGARRVDDQIGLEETPDEWCAKLVAVMREARRVLRSDGVCWIEVGDTYCSTAPGTVVDPSLMDGKHVQTEAYRRAATPPACKPKDLVGAPWLLAFALRADGWYLRSDTIWARPNPMPESVTDRPTKAHSYVFLLSKSPRYYFDADAIREDSTQQQIDHNARYAKAYDKYDEGSESRADPNNGARPGRGNAGIHARGLSSGRNARSVWTISTEPTPFAHFATFPQALVERCIKAGTSEHGACSECGAPWRRITETEVVSRQATNNGNPLDPHGRGTTREQLAGGYRASTITTGWEPSCDCRVQKCNHVFATPGYVCSRCPWELPSRAPCVVLDPFMGSGTTALVARRLGRHAIGIELNAEYLAIAGKRLSQLSLLA